MLYKTKLTKELIGLIKDGVRVRAQINGDEIIEDAVLNVPTDVSGALFLCHNHINYIGSCAYNKHGYRYSWMFSITPTNVCTEKVSLLEIDGVPVNTIEFFTKPNVLLGGDPEILLESDGKIYESASLDEDKLKTTRDIARDGYQAELHPDAHGCREVMWGKYVASALKLEEKFGFVPVTGAGRWIPQSEFVDLTDASKRFGCVPSSNIYGAKSIDVDAMFYMFRPLGGHIHLGFDKQKVNLAQFVRLLDIFVGNTSVLFDQNDTDLQQERRKNYGRAGEFREKPYGVEYRTLSNFWLKNYVYMSMVYGLARQALALAMQDPKKASDLESLFGAEIEEAINSNDSGLALKNFAILRKFIEEDECWNLDFETHTLNTETLKGFDGFYADRDKFNKLNFHTEAVKMKSTGSRGNGIERTLLAYRPQ